jgi:hypothetical protein
MTYENRTKSPRSTGPERNGLPKGKSGFLAGGPVNRFSRRTAGNLRFSARYPVLENVVGRRTGGGKATGIQHSLSEDRS